MKAVFRITVLLLVVSCQLNKLDEERILNIGKQLAQTEFTQTNSKPIYDIVMLGKGLKGEMVELQKNATKFEFEIMKGDLKSSFGDNRADVVLKINSDYKNIGIRLKYDKTEDKYHILGWMTLNNDLF
jgi:hypothetical protein